MGPELGALQNLYRVPGEEDPGVDEDVFGERAQEQRVELGHVADGAAGEAAAADRAEAAGDAGRALVHQVGVHEDLRGKRAVDGPQLQHCPEYELEVPDQPGEDHSSGDRSQGQG